MGPRERHRYRRAKTHIVPAIIASFFGFMLIAGVAFGIGMLGNIDRWLQDLPDYTNADLYLTSEPTTILDAQGNEIASLYSQNRTSVTLDQISDYVKTGTVDTEDERFYEHGGFDPIGIARAAVVQLMGGSEGASTITQQLVRNTILSDEQFDITIERKVREIYLAVKVEEIYSKDEILNMYLNTIYYGHGAYGIEAAAQTYLSKSAADVTLAEAALLVGLPNAPSMYDPTVSPDLAVQRRNTVLDRMYSNGHITAEERDAAKAEPLTLNVSETSSTGVQVNAYPYFVDYVRQLLEEEFSYDSIFSGGLTVYTTIDPTVQQAAETAVTEQLNRYDLDGLEAGMTILDNDTGAIVAMVGGSDYYADEEHINHALAERQVGSSFKAFTLAAAINAGMDPDIMLNCNSPMVFDNGSGGDYRVQNYGNSSYGRISLRRATELSSNTGYVQVALAIGVQKVVDLCRDLGIDDDTLQAYPATTLGVEDLTTLQMAEAYSTFATGGYHREAIAITRIENRNGGVVYEHQDAPEKVLDTAVTQAVTDVLEGVISNSGATGTAARLSVDQPIAGKTGTSQNTADLWFCCYTPQYTLAVWSGYTQGSVPIYIYGREALGSDLTLPMARNTLNTILANVPREEFPSTDETVDYKDNSEWEVDGEPLEYGYSAPVVQTTPETTTDDGTDDQQDAATDSTTSNVATPDSSTSSDGSSGTSSGTGGTSSSGGSTGGGNTQTPSTGTGTSTPSTGTGGDASSSGSDGTSSGTGGTSSDTSTTQ